MEYFSKSEEETKKIAENFAKTLKSGDIVALFGDLGVGKTVFTKGVCSAFGLNKSFSPTFTILNEYLGGKIPLYHFDMYRLKNEDELQEIGIEDYFYGNGICLIEWPERILGWLPSNLIRVEISRIDDNSRKINIIKLEF